VPFTKAEIIPIEPDQVRTCGGKMTSASEV